MLPSPPSEMEAGCYYAGLPSRPVLVARTGTPWKQPTGPEAYSKINELHPVGNHALKEVWEDNLALKLHALLDSMNVKWTSTDVVRLQIVEEPSAPVIVWIGVVPASLSGNDGVVVAYKCRDLLVEFNISDVDVEIRESVVTRSARPKLLKPTDSFYDPTADVRVPLTATLGLPICAQSTPWAEGTGGFFFAEGGNTERLLLVTARHVVFTPDKNENEHFERQNDSQRRYDVRLFGDAAFNKYLESIRSKIEGEAINADYRERSIRAIAQDNPAANKKRQEIQAELDKTRKAAAKLGTFYQEVSTRWATSESRILGHVILSPPISVGSSSSEGYTEDWAVIEIDASKVNASNFKCNAIDLGTRIPVGEFARMMSPDSRDPYSFEYPWDRFLELKGTIADDEMRHPTALDHNDNPCLLVIKRGSATDLTVGRANDIYSYARNYKDYGKAETSKEWAILPFGSKSGSFSAEGDSGSVIVDGLGRIGGIITSGAGSTSDSDITYATPISFLLKRMQENGLHEPNVNPVLTA